MTEENIKFGIEALSDVLAGVEILNSAVSSTIGPRGRVVLIENGEDYPILTKDGVSISRKIKLKDKFKRLGCDTIKGASEKTCSVVGDATSTTILLSYEILKEGVKLISSGFSPTDLKKGIEIGAKKVIENLEKMAVPVDDEEKIRQIATISANNDEEIGDLVFKAVKSAGRDGVSVIEKSNSFKSEVEVIEGMRLDGRGYTSPYFCNNQKKGIVELENPYIFISTKKLSSHEEIIPLLEKIVQSGNPILFICEAIEGTASHTLITNKLKGTLSCCSILAPGIGEWKYHALQDLCELTGGELITTGSGHSLEKLKLSSLGRCSKVIVSRNDTTIIGGKGDKQKIQKRTEDIREQLLDPTLNSQEKSVLQERLAKLSGGVSVIKVGGATQAEMEERFFRTEDSLCASKSALFGVLPGGGVALIRASNFKVKENYSRDVAAGIEIVKNACSSLLKKIVENTGSSSPDVVLNKVLEMGQNEGFNALNEKYEDLVETGVLDPLLAPKSALENAVSASTLLLISSVSIVFDEEEKEKQSHSQFTF